MRNAFKIRNLFRDLLHFHVCFTFINGSNKNKKNKKTKFKQEKKANTANKTQDEKNEKKISHVRTEATVGERESSMSK